MKVLVLSNRHHLLPFANKLTEFHDVETVVLKDRYESCYNLTLPKLLVGKEKSIDSYKKLFKAIKDEDGIIITDSRKMTQAALDANCLTYGVLSSQPISEVPNLLLTGWFNGEKANSLALAVPDWGLWPGGFGSFVLAGVTISWHKAVQLSAIFNAFIPVDKMKSDSFRGMFNVFLKFDGNGFSQIGYNGGWTPILSHAYLANFSWSDFNMKLIVDKLHSVALPVSIPPYPLECNYKTPQLELNPDLGGLPELMLHDITESEDALRTAGTDGLVAVATSAADRLTKARLGALALASKVQIPQVQWRSDVGILAERMFDLLEDYGL